jgi:acetyl esterase/lipase
MSTDPSAESITVHRDVSFHDTPGRALSMDVFEPVESGPRPTLLFVHGGAFHEGDKDQLETYAREFADRGYVTATCQYRLADEATFPAALVDVKAAIEYLRSEADRYGVDGRRIGAVGWSAGANLAALAAVTAKEPGFEPEGFPGTSSELQAVVGYAGLYDFEYWDEDVAEHSNYLGGTREERPAAYDLASPAGQVSFHTPPTLLVHGTEDDAIPLEQSDLFARDLDAMTDARFEPLDGAGHEFPLDAFDETVELTAEFLRTNL